MKVLIINGSPKGDYSTTLQTALYITKKFPEVEFSFINAAQQIRSLEKDFTPALQKIHESDVLLFCYPVYTFIVPSQLHRFIELMKESGQDFSSKAASQITTSKHFYDITAHRFIEDNCHDMGISIVDGLSADMDDLLTPTGQKQALDFFRRLCWSLERGYFKHQTRPSEAAASDSKDRSLRAVIVADITGSNPALVEMVERFRSTFPYGCDLVNIREFPFKGGCISCFNCSSTGKCIYKDGFDDFLRNDILKHDAIVYAFTIKDHSMGHQFKLYDDRQFCNGHRTMTMGMPIGYLVDGDLSEEDNLRLIMDARVQVGSNFPAGVATNGDGGLSEVDRLAATIAFALENRLSTPQNFLGVGGMKIFRDLIYLMRGMMKADHTFFKTHGQYDFPQKKWGTSMKSYLVGWLMGSKALKAKMGNKMNEGMIAPYRKVIDES